MAHRPARGQGIFTDLPVGKGASQISPSMYSDTDGVMPRVASAGGVSLLAAMSGSSCALKSDIIPSTSLTSELAQRKPAFAHANKGG